LFCLDFRCTNYEQVNCWTFHAFIHPTKSWHCQKYCPISQAYLYLPSISRKFPVGCRTLQHTAICPDRFEPSKCSWRHLSTVVLCVSSTSHNSTVLLCPHTWTFEQNQIIWSLHGHPWG
jgi:hypothetical protein